MTDPLIINGISPLTPITVRKAKISFAIVVEDENDKIIVEPPGLIDRWQKITFEKKVCDAVILIREYQRNWQDRNNTLNNVLDNVKEMVAKPSKETLDKFHEKITIMKNLIENGDKDKLLAFITPGVEFIRKLREDMEKNLKEQEEKDGK